MLRIKSFRAHLFRHVTSGQTAAIWIAVAGLWLLSSSAMAVRGRPYLDTRLGFNRLLSDQDTLLRGVSLSWDGGDPYGSLPKVVPSQAQLNSLATDYGLNTVHLYLEADSSGNNNPIGYNAADADLLVQRTSEAGLYLIITIGNNGENGTIHDLNWSTDFWEFYGPRYKDATHVLYEAHNEPALYTPNQWSISDWNNQLTLYDTIRTAAPETFTLLGSFMGFAGDPRFGANYLSAGGVDWSNAGFAHHGYESLAGIENAISLMQSSTSYPALLATEFWPGDTVGQGYNSMYESRFNGWMQFQWLGANDEDLHDFKSKINAAGTVWTPDMATANWPAQGTLDIPPSGSIVGIFSRDNQMFLSADPADGHRLRADLTNYTGTQNDAFVIEKIDDRFVSLKAANGLYVSTNNEADALSAQRATVSETELFEWLRLPNGDIALRAFGGGGHLIQRDAATGFLFPNEDNGHAASANFVIVNTPGSTPAPLIGNPYYGTPQAVPGLVRAEDFDLGGNGEAYHDTTAGNLGGKYRTLEDVDIESSTDSGGGYNVGWLGAGEWLEYTIEVTSAVSGDYVLTTRVATQNTGGAFFVEFDGINETGTLTVPNTGGWQDWADVATTVTLDPGVQLMRFVRAGIAEFNVNHFTLTLLNLDCDFSGDGLCDVSDVDLLQSLGPVATGVPAAGNEEFDLNDDGVIDLLDRDQWLADAAAQNSLGSPYKLGDANLDGSVDGQDFLAWNAAKFTSSLRWSDGNFNGDAVVDGKDFLDWNSFKFQSSDVARVPEPATVMWFAFGLLVLGRPKLRR